MGTLSDQFSVPPFGPVTTLQDARSHDIHEDRDNGEWCAMPLCHGLSSLLTLHNFCVERYSDSSAGSDDLQPPPAKKHHQEGV